MPVTQTMWTMTVPWWELIARSLIVYLFLLTLIRLTGKRSSNNKLNSYV